MRKIDSFFESSVDRTLYHYTGIGALLGIAESNSLWASHIYFLNDSEEIAYACDIFKEILGKYLRSAEPNPEERNFVNQLILWIEQCKKTHFSVFVFSLSERSSLLSQWRSYTPHGKGVSIGIPAGTIGNLIKRHDLRIGKCLYKMNEQVELVEGLIFRIIETFRQKSPDLDISKEYPPTCYFKFLEDFRGDVLQVLSLIKHSAYEEEQEWRLVSPYHAKYVTPVIKFREGASMLVPYIELELGNKKPFFERVLLGPSTFPNLSMSALSMFLSNKGICHMTENCSIPYREW